MKKKCEQKFHTSKPQNFVNMEKPKLIMNNIKI